MGRGVERVGKGERGFLGVRTRGGMLGLSCPAATGVVFSVGGGLGDGVGLGGVGLGVGGFGGDGFGGLFRGGGDLGAGGGREAEGWGMEGEVEGEVSGVVTLCVEGERSEFRVFVTKYNARTVQFNGSAPLQHKSQWLSLRLKRHGCTESQTRRAI